MLYILNICYKKEYVSSAFLDYNFYARIDSPIIIITKNGIL